MHATGKSLRSTLEKIGASLALNSWRLILSLGRLRFGVCRRLPTTNLHAVKVMGKYLLGRSIRENVDLARVDR